MGDYVSANGRSFPALLVMLEIDGIWQIQQHTLCTHARCRRWMGVFLGVLSRTSGMKDGDTKERGKQWTNTEEGENTKTTLQYCLAPRSWPAPHMIFLIIIRRIRDTKTIKNILLNDFLKYLVTLFFSELCLMIMMKSMVKH